MIPEVYFVSGSFVVFDLQYGSCRMPVFDNIVKLHLLTSGNELVVTVPRRILKQHRGAPVLGHSTFLNLPNFWYSLQQHRWAIIKTMPKGILIDVTLPWNDNSFKYILDKFRSALSVFFLLSSCVSIKQSYLKKSKQTERFTEIHFSAMFSIN